MPRAIAADKKASAEFGPEAGALIALRAYVGTLSFFLERSNSYPTIPELQCSDDLQKNQIAIARQELKKSDDFGNTSLRS